MNTGRLILRALLNQLLALSAEFWCCQKTSPCQAFVQDLPFALHFYSLRDGADFHNDSLIGRARRVDDDAFVNGRVEPLLADGQGVTARRQGRKDKAAVGAGGG